MRSERSKPLFAGIIAAAVMTTMLALQGCMEQADGNDAAEAEESETQDETAAIPVEAATVSLGNVAAFYSGTATLEADQRAEVVSEITGVVQEILAEEGDFVEKHQVLARVTDNAGNSQSQPQRNSNLLAGTFPDGTHEMHRVVVQVRSK